MTKTINKAINSIYLKLSNPRQFVALVVFAGNLLTSLATNSVSVALADEGALDGNSAFLTVQPFLLEERESNEIVWQNELFASASQRGSGAVVAPKTPVKAQGRVVTVTAYSSTPDQTDDSPFITANGTYVHDGIIAANFLPFGTKVKFPQYSGDKIYTVQDRMAKKNSHKIDIWMPTRGDALQFGVKKLAYEIVE